MNPSAGEFDDFERRLIDEIGELDSSLREDLAEVVALPTGHDHREGLDRCRDWFRSRLERIGATIDLVPGRPRPEWLEIRTQPADDPRAESREGDPTDVPPTLVASSSAGDGVDAVRFLLCGHLDTVHDPHGSFQAMTA
ncbi:MAG: hypothetical protein VX012_06815, partial [Planctomycetota bacterium]|nr:hypothetical protein [Planctomycetota bacterium]